MVELRVHISSECIARKIDEVRNIVLQLRNHCIWYQRPKKRAFNDQLARQEYNDMATNSIVTNQCFKSKIKFWVSINPTGNVQGVDFTRVQDNSKEAYFIA